MAAFGIRSHTRRVCSLYKNALRTIDAWYEDRCDFLYQMALMRNRFDQNKNLKDCSKIEQLLVEGEKEFFLKQHYQPKKFPHSPGGSAYARNVDIPDWVLDYWHPLEKARYPHYFAVREKRKKEYIELWEKTYGKPKELEH